MTTPALAITHVSKSYHDKKNHVLANENISLTIRPGQIYGLLGPNGAGKSTLISLLSGQHIPDSGTIELFGINVVTHPARAKRLLGLVPQEIVTEPAFTVYEVLYYTAGLHEVPMADRQSRITEVLASLELSDKTHAKARTLSGGQKRRLMIAKAILHKPRFLVLDEPTAGVDVSLRQTIWQLVKQLQHDGTTILFTTHYLEEAEQLCDELTFIDRGKVIKTGTLANLQKDFDGGVIYFEIFNHQPHLQGVTPSGNEWELPTTDLPTTLATLAHHYGQNLKSLRSENVSLEKIFLSLTGKNSALITQH